MSFLNFEIFNPLDVVLDHKCTFIFFFLFLHHCDFIANDVCVSFNLLTT